MYLHTHVRRLFASIRSRALAQYTAPYSAVDLRRMASVFGTPLDALEDELCALIARGTVPGRIDAHHKVLRRYVADKRAEALQAAERAATAYAVHARAVLLRAALVRQGLSVRLSTPGGAAGDPLRAPVSGGGAMDMGCGPVDDGM